jgi:hypothetical protein
MKPVNRLRGKNEELLIVKTGGTYSYHWVLRGQMKTILMPKCFNRYVQSVINPLKPKLAKIIFKNSVRTAKKTQHFTITKIN